MKIRVNSSYPLFADCMTYGQVAGSNWWVVARRYSQSVSVMLIILPCAEAAAQLDAGGSYRFRLKYQSECLDLKRLSRIWTSEWSGIREYPALLRNALYMDVAWILLRDVPRELGRVYLVEKRLLTSTPPRSYDNYYNKWRLNEEELISACEQLATRACEQMLADAQ